jgi:hypothetical protein
MINTESRKFVIKVIGFYRQDKTPKSNYTLIVPYSSLSQTLKQIHQKGGKITEIIELNRESLELSPINNIEGADSPKKNQNIELLPLPLPLLSSSSQSVLDSRHKSRNKRKSRFNRVKCKQSRFLPKKKCKSYVLG